MKKIIFFNTTNWNICFKLLNYYYLYNDVKLYDFINKNCIFII